MNPHQAKRVSLPAFFMSVWRKCLLAIKLTIRALKTTIKPMSSKEKDITGNLEDLNSPDDLNSTEADETPELAKAEPEVELSEEEKLKFKVSELNDKFLRLYAEFDNYKKRTATERLELMKTAGKDVIVSLLPVLDDFDRALQVMETATDIISVKEGIQLVRNKFNKTLEQRGLKEMNSIGEEFNSDIQEAVTSIPAAEEMAGKVVEVLEKGYLLNDKVIRFAKVIVGN